MFMLRTERMVRLTLVGPKSMMEETIQACYALNLYHIVDHKKSDDLDLGSPLPRAELLSEILLKIRGLIAHLQIKSSGPRQHIRKTRHENFYQLGQRARSLYEDVTALLERRKTMEEQ